MTTNILINNISGASPFNIYLCDSSNITCIYINTIPSSSLPYNFEVPVIMGTQTSFSLKVVDSNNCTFYQNLSVIVVSNTPTPTPTITPTNTITPTITPTNTITPTITPTNTITPTVTPTSPEFILELYGCCDLTTQYVLYNPTLTTLPGVYTATNGLPYEVVSATPFYGTPTVIITDFTNYNNCGNWGILFGGCP